MIQLFSTAMITVLNLQNSGSSIKKEERIVAAFSLLLIWAKCFDWLKLFDSTALYIELLGKTLQDTGYFMILLMVTLAMFGSSIFMLQNNKDYGKEEDLINPVFGNTFLDSMLNQYLLGLGEFSIDEFEGHPQSELCWMFFILATFFT